MAFLRLIFAYAILFCLAIFFYSSAREVNATAGYLFLGLAVASFFVLVAVSEDLLNMFIVKNSTLALIAFLLYFSVKWYFESEDSYSTIQMTIGTTGGVVFAVVLGLMCSYALAKIYEFRTHPQVSGVTFMVGLVYITVVLALGLNVFLFHFSNVGSDVFLIEEREGEYQRVGDYMTIQLMVVVALVSVFISTSRRGVFFKYGPLAVLVLGITLAYGLTAQIIGSNSGLVATAGFALVFLIIYVLASFSAKNNRSVGVAQLVFGSLGIKILLSAVVGAAALGAAAFVGVKRLGIDISEFRIGGFGTGELTSLTSRQEFAKENFWTHFAYSPLFGNTQVDVLTTGEGTYSHSLIDILPFTGILGTLIFCALLFFIYKDITNTRGSRSSETIYNNSQYSTFRLVGLVAALAMCAVSAIFTWIVLWFAIGLFGNWFHQQSHSRKHSDKSRRRRVRRPMTPRTA